MYIDAQESHCLYEIFLSQHLSTAQSLSLVGTLKRWESSYGIHFVVKRLKAMKAALLTGDLTGLRTRKDGSLWGPFRCVFSRSTLSRKDAIRMDRILRVYGRWTSLGPSQDQWKDYKSSIEIENTQSYSIIPSDKDLVMGHQCELISHFPDHIPLSNSKVVPFTRLTRDGVMSYRHYEQLLEYCPQLVWKHKQLLKSLWDFDSSARRFCFVNHFGFQQEPTFGLVGKICALVSDRGMKIRYIANPLIGVQLATGRLQMACNLFLQRLPESLVHEQEAVEQWVLPILQSGQPIWSIDLSSATDHFPLSIQESLLRDLFPGLGPDIDLWSDVSRSRWSTPIGPVRFLTGQPMGVSASFSAFALTHTLFIRSLGGNSSNFRTCGDDVVISDPALAKAYMDKIEQIGVKISVSKSLMGFSKAEFAGRIFDKYGRWESFKANKMDLGGDPLGMLRQYGLAGLKLIPLSLRPKLAFFASLPLSGLRNCEDPQLLDLIDDRDVELFFPPGNEESYPIRHAHKEHSVWQRKVSVNERFFFRRSIVGPGVSNNPVLVEHVLSNTPKSIFEKRSTLMDILASSLEKGQSLNPGPTGDTYVKTSLGRLKRLHKLLLV